MLPQQQLSTLSRRLNHVGWVRWGSRQQRCGMITQKKLVTVSSITWSSVVCISYTPGGCTSAHTPPKRNKTNTTATATTTTNKKKFLCFLWQKWLLASKEDSDDEALNSWVESNSRRNSRQLFQLSLSLSLYFTNTHTHTKKHTQNFHTDTTCCSLPRTRCIRSSNLVDQSSLTMTVKTLRIRVGAWIHVVVAH